MYFAYRGKLCVSNVGKLRQHILVEAYNSRYSIHPVSTKMYHDLQEVYWWNAMKRDIAYFVSNCPNYKPGGMSEEIDIPYLEVGCDQYGFYHRVTSYSKTA